LFFITLVVNLDVKPISSITSFYSLQLYWINGVMVAVVGVVDGIQTRVVSRRYNSY